MKIIIISVEGLKSHTEINYYKGFSYHLKNIDLKAFAIGKTANKGSSIRRTHNSIRTAISMNNYDPKDSVTIFFIGDGDAKTDIPSMKKSIEVASSFLRDFFEKCSINNILIKDDCSFEKPFEKVNCKSIYKGQKRGSNLNLFKNIATELNWFVNDELNFDKIISDYKKMDTNHMQIVLEILKNENDK